MRKGSGNLIQDDMSKEESTRKSKVMAEAECAGQPVKGELYLKPVIFCLGIAGCYSFQQRKHLFTEILMFAYKIIVVTSVLFWCITMTIENSHSVPTYIIVFMITLEGICNWVICWKMFSKAFGNFQASMNQINDLLAELRDNSIVVNKKYIYKRQITYLILAILLILSDVGLQISIAYVFVPNPEELEAGKGNATSLYVYPLPESYFTRALFIIPSFLQSFSLVIPPLYLAVISTVLLATFNALNSKLDESMQEMEGNLDYIEMVRRFHVKTCVIILQLDRDLRYFYGSIFFWALCQAILVLYILIKLGRSVMELTILFYMMGLNAVVVIVMAISAAEVHEAAHAPLDMLYKANVETISLEKATQLSLFISKLTGTQVGFTTCGLLTITKEFILTIAGVFISYFAVLYTTV